MRVAVYVKKQIRLDRLDTTQRQMFTLGNVGLASRKNDIAKGLTPSGNAAKPLTKRYAIRKTRLGKGNRRNLSFTGDMLRNWQVRSVSSNRADASFSTRSARAKARGNQATESFIDWSRNDTAAVMRAGDRVMAENAKRLAVERFLGR